MSDGSRDPRTRAQLLEEIEQLRLHLEEAEQTLEAIRHGEVDALVVTGPQGEQIFTLTGAEHIYRVIVETMNEAALMVDPNGTILFCNHRFCDLLNTPIQEVMGRKVTAFVARPQQMPLKTLLTDAQAEPVQRRLTLRAGDGTAVPVQISASLLRANNSASICLVASDLTELETSANSIRILREHEQALRESEERYHRLFEDDLTGNLLYTPEGQILLCNPALARIFGFASAQDAVGTNVLDLYIDAKEREPLLERLRQEGKIERLEVWRKRHDGELIYIVENLVGHFDEQGELYEIKGYIFDDTERKEAEQELARQRELLQAIIDNIPVFLVLWDGQLREFRFNEEFHRVMGWTEAEAADGDFLARVYPDPDYRRQAEQYMRSLQPGWRDFQTTAKDGSAVDISWANVHLSGDRSVGIGVDIRERKRAEEASRDLAATLESKVAQRTAELQYRARQLQKLALDLSQAEDSERRRLAEILHDDLQQMLAAAKFHLGLLGTRAKRDPAQQAVLGEVEHLLIEAIEKSRSLSHELSPAVLYHDHFGGALGWLASQVQSKHGLEATVDAFGEVRIESDAIKSCLYKAAQEMLFNAVKHARVNQAKIRVRRLGRYICLSVSDQGRGFDPQELRQTAGFGLLSIRERIELLGGRMKIHSVKGQGSTFHLVVPDGPLVEDGDASAQADKEKIAGTSSLAYLTSATPGSQSGSPLRVLLADDHRIVREGLMSLLGDEHDILVVGEAANGREAINEAHRLRPDVVIMDVAMPLINGDDATRQIKRHLPGTRVIALSMYEEPEMVEKMQRAGAESYILKTAPSEELLAAIRGKPKP